MKLIGKVHVQDNLRQDGIIVSGDSWYDINSLKDEDMSVEFIASTLSKICRYIGHIYRLDELVNHKFNNKIYSVAQHSVMMAESILITTGDPYKAKQALLHDAPEAFFGDIISPLKRNMENVKVLEIALERRIFGFFGIPLELDPYIKQVDSNICIYEITSLIGSEAHESEFWSPKQSAERFVSMYNRIELYIKIREEYYDSKVSGVVIEDKCATIE
jgi:hypothetical protein